MGCKCCKTESRKNQENVDNKRSKRSGHRKKRGEDSKQRHQPKPEIVDDLDKPSDDGSRISEFDSTIERPETIDTVSQESVVVDEFIDIEVADSQAFNQNIIEQRQQAVKNTSYRSVIESWQPNSLPQLAETIKIFLKGKSLVDRHWIIFYWVTLNIEYDTVSYFSKDYKDQSAEGVFRTKKGVCAGYANIYKYLCDHLQMPCEVVGGYSKGYGFDDREGAPTETDHAWNAVEIYNHWYLMESTWGAGHLNEQKTFTRELDSYYFLPRPNEMIYHHLPEDDKWQLLETPIQMAQYMQMPKLRPLYFEFELEMIQPRNQCFVNLEKNEPFALVIMKTPADIYLIADLKLHDQKVDGGHRVIFDKKKRHYCCYFAPANIGDHKITIYAKRGDTDVGLFSAALDLVMKIKEMPKYPISYPKTWKCFSDLGIQLLSPLKTHLIKLDNGEKFVQILVRTPSDIQLIGQLKNHKDEKVLCGDRVYYDRKKDFWRCKFAPNENGIFDALILAKKKSDPGSYTSAISFKLNANQIRSSSFSFPNTWPIFYDFDLKILSPVGRGIIVLRDKVSFVEILIKAPDDVGLLSQLHNDKDEKIPRGDNIHYDDEKDCWRCTFAPNGNGMFDGLILAKKKSDPGSYTSAVSFKIQVKQLASESVSLLQTTQLFYDLKLKVLSPVGNNKIILSEKSSFAEICLKIPKDVELIGQLMDSDRRQIPDADEVYYDRHKDIWRCKFAPNHTGIFDGIIMAKKKSDSSGYSTAVTFPIEANHIRTPPVTFPKTWQPFYDFDLKIQAPRSRSTAVWSDKASYAEILIRAPNDIQLSCSIAYKNETIENGTLAQYDHDKSLWQLLFAPERTGQHELFIFARRIDDNNTSANSVVRFHLNVTNLGQLMKFPVIYTQFETTKCRIYTPLDGRLKRGSVVTFHCLIPDATSVKLSVDSKTLQPEGYADSILEKRITVGSEEVIIYAKYGQNPHYTSLIKYSVE